MINKKAFQNIIRNVFKNKFFIFLFLIILVIAGYYGYNAFFKKNNTIQYSTAKVEKGTLTISVSGTGQVSASNEIDIKSMVSGKIIYLNLEEGREVKEGTLLAQLDAKEASRTVKAAENNLLEAQISLTSENEMESDAKEALDIAINKGLDAITKTLNDFSSSKNLETMFKESSYNSTESDVDYYLHIVKTAKGNQIDLTSWKDTAENEYIKIEEKIDEIQDKYWKVSKNDSVEEIQDALTNILAVAKEYSDLIRKTLSIIQQYQKIIASENLSMPIATTITSNHFTQLSTFNTLFAEDINALLNAKSEITNKKISLAKVKVEINSQNLALQQYENALISAKENLAKYYLSAPITGTVASVNKTIRIGDEISNGTKIASIVSLEKVVIISLNEIDVAKVKLGQKAILTFDAIPDLTLTGKVSEIDTLGTVSQGVVSYNVKITLDTDDERIKPGMSATAEIIITTKTDVLLVPNSAVKSQQNIYYVQIMKSDNTISTQEVEVGLSNDSMTEIISGLQENDIVIIATLSQTKNQTTQKQRTQQFQIPGMNIR